MSQDKIIVVCKGDVIVSAAHLSSLYEQRAELLDALKATQIDLRILRGNVLSAAKTENRWDGMADVIDEWISRNDSVIEKTEANQ